MCPDLPSASGLTYGRTALVQEQLIAAQDNTQPCRITGFAPATHAPAQPTPPWSWVLLWRPLRTCGGLRDPRGQSAIVCQALAYVRR